MNFFPKLFKCHLILFFKLLLYQLYFSNKIKPEECFSTILDRPERSEQVEEFCLYQYKYYRYLEKRCFKGGMDIKWYKDNILFKKMKIYKQEIVSDLIFYPVYLSDSGIYTIYLKNYVINTSHQFNLTVIKGRQINVYNFLEKNLISKNNTSDKYSIQSLYWMSSMLNVQYHHKLQLNHFVVLNCAVYSTRPLNYKHIRWYRRFSSKYYREQQYQSIYGDPLPYNYYNEQYRIKVITEEVECKMDIMLKHWASVGYCYTSMLEILHPMIYTTAKIGQYMCVIPASVDASVSNHLTFSFVVSRINESDINLIYANTTRDNFRFNQDTSIEYLLNIFTGTPSKNRNSFLLKCWSVITLDTLKIARLAPNNSGLIHLASGNGAVTYDFQSVTPYDSGRYFCVSTLFGTKTMKLTVHSYNMKILFIIVTIILVIPGVLTIIWKLMKERRNHFQNTDKYNKNLTGTKFQLNGNFLKSGQINKIVNSMYFYNYSNKVSSSTDEQSIHNDCDSDGDLILASDQLIGQGAFGMVYRGRLTSGSSDWSQEVAVKSANCPSGQILLQSEVKVMQYIDYHPNIISLMHACNIQDKFVAILELAPLGNLKDYLMDHNPLFNPECTIIQLDQMISYAQQIADAMNYLSSKYVIHRDLAARNILLVDNNTVKISDFGLSVKCQTYYKSSSELTGPIRHMAPECFTKHRFSVSSDIWAYGILLWEIFELGKSPYPTLHTNNEVEQAICSCKINEQPQLCPDILFNRWMLKCWSFKPNDRPQFHDIWLFLRQQQSSNIEYLEPFRRDSTCSGEYLEPFLNTQKYRFNEDDCVFIN